MAKSMKQKPLLVGVGGGGVRMQKAILCHVRLVANVCKNNLYIRHIGFLDFVFLCFYHLSSTPAFLINHLCPESMTKIMNWDQFQLVLHVYSKWMLKIVIP